MWVDKNRILLRENKTKVVTTIDNYLNNSEGFRKADGELTNPCMYAVCITVSPLWQSDFEVFFCICFMKTFLKRRLKPQWTQAFAYARS